MNLYENYDLITMTGPFRDRLEMFVSEAQERDIIVQIELWDRFAKASKGRLFRSVGLLNVLHEYDCGDLGRKP